MGARLVEIGLAVAVVVGITRWANCGRSLGGLLGSSTSLVREFVARGGGEGKASNGARPTNSSTGLI